MNYRDHDDWTDRADERLAPDRHYDDDLERFDREYAWGARGYGGTTYARDYSTSRRPAGAPGYGHDSDRYSRQAPYDRPYNPEAERHGRRRWRQRDAERDRPDYDPHRRYEGGYGMEEPAQAYDYYEERSSRRAPSSEEYYGAQDQYGRSYPPGYGRDRQGYGARYGRDFEGETESGPYDEEPGLSNSEAWWVPGPQTGRGPRGYHRSSERIYEEVCDRLTQHGHIDASEIEVSVDNGEVTLKGNVTSREEKRLVEDVADYVSGVRDVHNRLKIT